VCVCVCVSIPFHAGSRRHTEGLLQVDLARGDDVGRLGQTDAAISEELKTSSGAGFLQRHTQLTIIGVACNFSVTAIDRQSWRKVASRENK